MKNFQKKFLLIVLMIMLVTAGCGSHGDSQEKNGIQETEEGTERKTESKTEAQEETKSQKEETETQEEETKTQEETTTAEKEPQTENQAATEAMSDEYSPVVLSFTGDIYFSDMLYNKYTASGLTGFLSESLVNRFQSADLMICDHEYAATNLPEELKAEYQLYTFKAPMEREVIWKELGVDIVTLANNHTMDWGEQGLLDTFSALNSAGVSYVGAGKNLSEASSAQIREINGKKIAILGTSRFVPNMDWYAQADKPGLMTTYEITDRFQMVKEEITRLKEEEKCDIVVVFVHFGTEKTNQINENQPIVAHGYVDAGADAVIGCHAHTLQGIEIYQGKPVYYNLGNFLFGTYAVDTMAVNLQVNEDNSLSSSIVPCTSSMYYTKEEQGEKAAQIFDYVESISVNVSIDEQGNVTEKTRE